MYCLGSNSCHVIVCYILLMKYICALFNMQLFMIANSSLEQFIIPEYHMKVNHKVGSNTNGIHSIFNVSHEYVKNVVPERKQSLSSKCHILILALTHYISRTLVRISFHLGNFTQNPIMHQIFQMFHMCFNL